MSDDALLQQKVEALEADNARLRRLLECGGAPAGLRHQVRNTLAMVRDIIRQTADRYEGVEDYAAHLEARLDAVFRIQNAIASRSLDGVALDALVTDELLAHAAREGERLVVAGPDVLLGPAAAGTLALAVHELSVNAIKFGALSASQGRLAVSWTVADGDDGRPWLTLHWVESGVEGVPPSPPRRGFGADVLEHALKYQLGGEGTLAFAPGGLSCTIRLPLSPEAGGPRRAAHGVGADPA